ncbi:hypothetical protein U6A24_03635 [Aquimarina gracilis]|uniref:DUF1700 domain-containing protein n=1 Tax=Aquimarina gracilis TaxID=874422 RepID=A0ABU5ZTE7_9FLAO|nr:hypothetical protein [Aquimarina gracilis]MEB3344536.1 hypothetical protein [Aquimarina gracilis]
MKLTEEQEDIIRDFIDSQGVTIESLKDDLLDHLCCVVDSDLRKGKPFNQSFDAAVQELAPNGLIDIECKTFFLLNTKRIIMMKKLMYLVGFAGSFALTIGVTFKLLLYPGANVFFMVGFLTLLLVFVPMLTFDRYKVVIARALSERLKIILGCLAAVVTGLAGLFKLLHWQGTSVLLLAGAFIFAVGFLPFLFFTMYKKSIA